MDNLFIPIIYDLLLFLMVVILYFCGKKMAKTGKIFSKAGVIAILTYTLNEGLRFGRGIDYNGYGRTYEIVASGGTTNRELLFETFLRCFSNFGIPYQGIIILQSFMFIVALLIFLLNFREIFAYALPIFIIFSLYAFENLIRWYMGFSFILCGMSLLIKGKPFYIYFLVSSIGCVFHIGILPVILVFYLLFMQKKILLPPYISTSVYILIGLFFKTDIMLFFAKYLDVLSFFSNRIEGYSANAEQWLTSGALGVSAGAFDSLFTFCYMFVVVWYGFKILNGKQSQYIFVYNLFIIGFMVKPLANQIELLQRYDFLFCCFGAVVAALLLVNSISKKCLFRLRYLLFAVIIVFQLNYFRHPWINPSYQYMYVWDQKKHTYNYLHSLWIKDMYKKYKNN